jgi:hypothetical protein
MSDVYVLRNKKTGAWIALDAASGGYPYDVSDILRAEQFHSKDDAERYIAVGSWKDYDNPLYELHRLTFATEQVDQRTGQELKNLRRYGSTRPERQS